MRAYRQGQQPFRTEVRPTSGAPIFLEEWERGVGRAGGAYAAIGGLYGLPPRWSHVMPAGDSGATAAPVIDCKQQMAYLALPAQVQGEPEPTYRWNSILARLPAPPPGGNFAYQVDAAFRVGLDTLALLDPTPDPVKAGSIGLIVGTDALLAAGWLEPFYFCGLEFQSEGECSPELWLNAQSLDEVAAGEIESFTTLYLTVLVVRGGAETQYTTFGGPDGISKIALGTQVLAEAPTVIGFAVRTEEPAPDQLGVPVSGYCEYIRVRHVAYGSLGAVQFGQTGGRNW